MTNVNCWKSISTAPRDGTEIIYFSNHFDRILIGSYCDGYIYSGGLLSEPSAIPREWSDVASCWMPLPEGPERNENGAHNLGSPAPSSHVEVEFFAESAKKGDDERLSWIIQNTAQVRIRDLALELMHDLRKQPASTILPIKDAPTEGEFLAENSDGDWIRVQRYKNPFGFQHSVINMRTGKWWSPDHYMPLPALATTEGKAE